ncbi:sister chromatid cohesion protein PDS5 homolog A isoform X1 [Tripterygium wilfordii]|uniref:sister chromatid cohesion protein PDS5 homolog A isoform X1 n=1 Tax=Tripterygium wilfordii TaxID=458696 RepID=UPI0018F859C2|nr:sister chromatid cohesion protein PDS5 homolog A isoform X1 [Tripterygium wilfordii]
MDESPLQLVSEIGTQLGQVSRLKKDFLVKSLRQLVSGLSQIKQTSYLEVSKKEAARKLEVALKPLRKNIVRLGLLQHTDKDVRLLVAICVSELFRILAPEPPFKDMYLRDVFKLIVSMFAELSDTTSPYFSNRVKILETVAGCKCCLIMLDIECDDLILDLFCILFSVVRENHQQSIIDRILSIMTDILSEEASQSLLDVVLQNLLMEGKGAPSAASQLAVSVIQTCSEKLQPLVCGFVISCSTDRDAVGSKLKELYHEIIYKIFQCAPDMLLDVIPTLTRELLTDQVDVRIKAVNLIGRLFALPEQHFAQNYRSLFVEFLKRLSDKSAEVRISAIRCAKTCYISNPTASDSHEVLTALEGRLLDFDERVRLEAVIVACDLFQYNLKIFPPKLISQATERLRDKKISVRKRALHKLIEVYQDYCKNCSGGHIIVNDHFEQIPCKVLMLCYDKDCKEFRAQNMELFLAEDLFPVLLPVEERTRHWIHMFSLFTPMHEKALNSVLSQKQRLQSEMRTYLAMRKKDKENYLNEIQKRMKSSFVKMSASFPDPSKAEECFNKLDEMKDNNIFGALALLLDDQTVTNARATRDRFLKMIGDKHPLFEFLRILSSKCLFNIFSSEHVRCIVDHLSSDTSGDKQLAIYSIRLLLMIVNNFPSLLRGSEVKFRMLLENHPNKSELIEVLAKAGPHILVEFSDYYPLLENLCFEGNRLQSKCAVSAIASLISSSKPFIFSELCEGLLDSLCRGLNIPTVLQSLGCIAQHSISAFEIQEPEIKRYIYENIFQLKTSEDIASFDETSGCSNSCKLKIYGLKTLVKSFLPHRGSHVKRQINDLLDTLLKMLQVADAFDATTSCENDRDSIRLAAAKSVLQLSRRWDLHISPELFRFTVLMAKDLPSFLRKSFLDKIHKLLKDRAIPTKYACAFALAGSNCLKDLQDDSFKYMAAFIKEYSKEARICQTYSVKGGSIMDYPAYIVVFLLHILAHDTGFPPENCQDEELYAQFCSPLFWVIQALVNASIVDGNRDLINDAVLHLHSIFRAIRRAEDAVDSQGTHKLHMLAEIGIYILKTLNHDHGSSSRALGSILLPSALYSANSKCPTRSLFYEGFLARVIHNFESKISLPGSIFPRNGRKCQENIIKYDVNHGTLNPASSKVITMETTGMQDPAGQVIRLGCRRKRATSTTSGSVKLRDDSTFEKEKGSPISKPIVEKGHLPSCSSVTMMASGTKSQVSVLNGANPSLIENALAAEPSKYSEVELKDPCSSEEITMAGSNTISQLCIFAEDSSGSSLKEMFSSEEEIGKLSCQITLLPERGKKGQKASIDTSRSAVISANKDAVVSKRRRRKV